MNRAGVIYFLEIESHLGNYIKIGFTCGLVANRMRAMRQWSPFELKWIGAFHGGQAEETRAHEMFNHLRRRVEWFEAAPEIYDFIEQKCKGFDPKTFQLETYRVDLLDKIRSQFGGSSRKRNEFLTRCGVDPLQFGRWREGSLRLNQMQYDAIDRQLSDWMMQ